MFLVLSNRPPSVAWPTVEARGSRRPSSTLASRARLAWEPPASESALGTQEQRVGPDLRTMSAVAARSSQPS